MHLLFLALLVLLGLFLLRLDGTLAFGKCTSLLSFLSMLFFGLSFDTFLLFVLALELHGATDALEKSAQLHGVLTSDVQNFILKKKFKK